MLLKNFMQDELQVSKGSVKMPIKGLIEQYRERYDEMSQDTSRPFTHTVYRTTPGDRMIVHVKVPSRSLPKFYYDVLLELNPKPNATTIEDCDVKIFSNCPSFVYTYAYVFFHLEIDGGSSGKPQRGMIIDQFTRKLPRDRLMIPGAENKLGKEALRTEPSTRNPLGLPYFDTSIYTAIFYLEDVTTLAQLQSVKNYKTVRQIFDNVDDFDHLMNRRAREVNRLNREKERTRKAEQAEADKAVKQSIQARRGGGVRQPTRITGGKTLSTPKSNRGRKSGGGVNRIG